MYLYEMKWIELYFDSSCPVCNKWLNLNRSEESLHNTCIKRAFYEDVNTILNQI